MRKLIVIILLCSLANAVLSQSFDPKLFNQLQFRFIGPHGNRMIAVAGEPGNPNVSYAGAASGGIWKTEDAGVSWKSIFDETEDSSIGALALAPSNPRQVWAGTGETFLIRPAHAVGNGVYKSSNAGKTWMNEDTANPEGFLKAHVLPGLSGIKRFIHTITYCMSRTN